MILKIQCLIVVLYITIQANAQQIRFQNQDIFINGVNMPWNEFGWDFGEHHLWGAGYDSLYFENTFAELEENGVNCVRMWVHCDGRASPNFDENGFVTGLDNGMLEELNDFVTRAKNHNLLVILTLWSHDLLENRTDEAGKFAGQHKDLITEADKTQSYLDHALTPIVQSLNHHCNLLAWEIISEPEWCMKILGGASTDQTIDSEAMQRFVGKCIHTIRANSSQYITVGSAYPCGNDYGQNKNYWHETEFERLGFDCEAVHVDFYSFHYFEWMNEDENVFEQTVQFWDVNKPILIAESAVKTADKNTLLPAKTQLEHAFDNNYAGILFWSVGANDEYSDWATMKGGIAAFSNEIQLPPITCDTLDFDAPNLFCRFYPNPVKERIYMDFHTLEEASLVIRLYDMTGRLIKNERKILVPSAMRTDWKISDLMNGVYIIEVWQARNNGYFKVFTEKIVKT